MLDSFKLLTEFTTEIQRQIGPDTFWTILFQLQNILQCYTTIVSSAYLLQLLPSQTQQLQVTCPHICHLRSKSSVALGWNYKLALHWDTQSKSAEMLLPDCQLCPQLHKSPRTHHLLLAPRY
jgi:hypothetical protein